MTRYSETPFAGHRCGRIRARQSQAQQVHFHDVYVRIEKLGSFLPVRIQSWSPLVRWTDEFDHRDELARLVEDTNEPFDDGVVLRHQLEGRFEDYAACAFFSVGR